MLALPAHGFVLLSMPKCASTALEDALAPRAEIVFKHNAQLKHINCRAFYDTVGPTLRRAGYPRSQYELVCLFREPISWLESWWRYRQAPRLARRADPSKFSGNLTFEEYAERYLDGDASGAVVRGRPARFVSMKGEGFRVGMNRMFALEAPEAWQAWLREKLGEDLEFPTANRSQVQRSPEVSPDLRRRLEEHFAPEYDIYEHLRPTGMWEVPWRYSAGG